MNNEIKIKALLAEKKELKRHYYNPTNRRNNGKPYAEAYELYGRRILEIEREVKELSNPSVQKKGIRR